MTDAAPANQRKAKTIGHDVIDLEHLHPNRMNPRPLFHFSENNPEIIALGESIKLDGLHNPLKVYELLPEQPGEYCILQGHRRYAGATVSHVMELDCNIVERPTSEREELEMLGSEDAYKRAWSESGLFQMRHAYNLSRHFNLKSPAHPEIAAKTGLPMRMLIVAEKLFQLEPEIQAFCIEYEQMKYDQSVSGERKKRGRLAGSGVRSAEFPPEKAALVWEIFEALRQYCTLLVSDMDDVQLQLVIARKASMTRVEDLRNFVAAIRSGGGRNPRPGLLTQIAELIRDDKRQVSDVVRVTRNTHVVKLAKALRNTQQLDAGLVQLLTNTDQLGGDLDLLRDMDRALLQLLRHADDLQRRLERVIRIEVQDS